MGKFLLLLIIWVITLVVIIWIATGYVWAHDLHLEDYNPHPIKTHWVEDGMIIQTEAFGWLFIYRSGDLNHSQLHMRVYDRGDY